MLEDIQNLIYALGFEEGPRPQGQIDNFALLVLAVIEKIMLQPLPWQKIKVAPGPKLREAMYPVLKEAMRALHDMDLSVLQAAKIQYQGQYDLVGTLFGGELSLGQNGYASFAKMMGTITNQPGYLIDQILIRVEGMLKACENHKSFRTMA